MKSRAHKITRASLLFIGILIVKGCMFIDAMLDKLIAERN